MQPKIDVSKITPEDITRICEVDDFNEAIYQVQTIIGQDDGGIAGVHFSGFQHDKDRYNIVAWDDKSQRLKLLTDYIKIEELWAKED